MLRWCVVLASLLLAGPAAAEDRIPVVASFSVIADMLGEVGGDRIDIMTIVGPGGDCELYQPTPADVARVARARAVFINDLNKNSNRGLSRSSSRAALPEPRWWSPAMCRL